MKALKHPTPTATQVAYLMGIRFSRTTPDGKDVRYGIKALPGQYVRPYKRDDGTDGMLDYSAVINYRRSL